MTPDELIMTRCLDQAERALKTVAPNPMVGACLVHQGKILSEGIHERYGEAHAEVNAIGGLRDTKLLSEASLFVTLEPCNHHGKTPPCTDLIISSGIKRVVVATRDPNPIVAGAGIKRLRERGITVVEDVLRDRARFINRRFFTTHITHRPYIILKWAETADGFIAREDFSSKWISGEVSRNLVHRWRAEEQAILVGAHTALVDNPQLTVRNGSGKNPIRVVFDRDLSLPSSRHLWNSDAPTLCFSFATRRPYGTEEVIQLNHELPVLPQITQELHQRKILSMLVEGGTRTLNQFIDQALWDETRIFKSSQLFHRGVPAPSQPALRQANHPLLKHCSSSLGGDSLEISYNGALAQRLFSDC